MPVKTFPQSSFILFFFVVEVTIFFSCFTKYSRPLILCVHTQTGVYAHKCTWVGQKRTLCVPLSLSTFFPWDSLSHWTWTPCFLVRLVVVFGTSVSAPLPPPLCWDYRHMWLCLALFLFDVSTRTFKFRRSCFCSKQPYPLNYLSSPTLKFLFHDGEDYYLFLTLHNFFVSPTLTPFLFSFSDMESRESRLFLNFWAQVILGLKVLK